QQEALLRKSPMTVEPLRLKKHDADMSKFYKSELFASSHPNAVHNTRKFLNAYRANR
ncbi:5480_t:CDS:1, partial [Paraglomus brasilianum]